jgi:Tol biopolymer transport system component/serine/threonine protein kinase
MTTRPERWATIERLYHEVLGRPAEARATFLANACAGDEELRREIESLLAQPASADAAFTRGAVIAAAGLVSDVSRSVLNGRRLGAYQILAPIGAGGMGEVYRARDTRLGRDVAIKILPRAFTDRPERLARFEREARVLASVNHPHIGAIHGIEDLPIGDGEPVRALVLELIEGDTLAERIARTGSNGLPLKEALEIARQIADALEAAHEKGIVHRDLKPANIKITSQGAVKVLDFGLAKLEAGPLEGAEGMAEAPTITVNDTREGLIVGTAAYMSPEQARGQAVDKRTDIWAFGCVLFEMLSGKTPFAADTVLDTLTRVLEHDPPWHALPPSTPESVVALLRSCLAKDAAARLLHVREAHQILTEALRDAATAIHRRKYWQTGAALRVLLVVTAVIVAAVIMARRGTKIPGIGSADPTEGVSLADARFSQLTTDPGEEVSPSLSPDGRSLLYASRASGNWDVYLLRVGGRNPINLTRESEADDTQPAFSPNGEYVAFRSERDGGGIFIMGATGESVKRLTDFGYDPAWSPDGAELVFSSAGFDVPSARGLVGQLWRVGIASGEIQRVATNVGDAVQPSWSPHGDRLAFWSIRSPGEAGGQRDIWTVAAAGGTAVRVTDDPAMDWNPVWSPDGEHLYFASDRAGSANFWRVAINEQSGQVLGPLQAVTRGGGATIRQSLTISRDGTRLAFVERIARSNIQRLPFDPVREMTSGAPQWVTQGSRQATTPSPSPDGRSILFSSLGAAQEDLFVIDTDGTHERQLTNDADKDRFPRWAPDGSRIVFYSTRSTGRYQIWSIRPDGSDARKVISDNRNVIMPSWSPDASQLAYYTGGEFVNYISRLDRDAQPDRLPEISDDLVFGVSDWSPDATRLAGTVFARRSSTNNPIGVAIYSLADRTFQRLTDFGWAPVWLDDSQRLLFPFRDRIYLVNASSRRFKEVASIGAFTIQPYGLSVSRDNRWLYYAVQMNEADVWLMQLPKADAERQSSLGP